MTQPADRGAATIKCGYEQFVPPPVPPGMYFDLQSWLILPQGVRPAGKGRVAASFFLAVLLFIVTLGIGYLIWAESTWARGQTPAQRILRLRCLRRDTGRVAGRKQMTLRQATGLLLNGELLMGPLLWVSGTDLNSVGDAFADTLVLHDPDQILPSSEAGLAGS
jgi:uncharacterized RDD family membrane protein YckC